MDDETFFASLPNAEIATFWKLLSQKYENKKITGNLYGKHYTICVKSCGESEYYHFLNESKETWYMYDSPAGSVFYKTFQNFCDSLSNIQKLY